MEENFEQKNDEKRRRPGMRLLFLLAGIAIGLLVAPNSGRANRAWIRQKWEGWMADRRRWQRDITGKTDYEMGRATGFAHNLGTRLGLVKEEVDLSDDVINQRVKTEIGENPKTGHIPRLNIDTFEGVVTIRGHADNEHLVRDVEDVAGRVKGVRKIVNKMTSGSMAASE